MEKDPRLSGIFPGESELKYPVIFEFQSPGVSYSIVELPLNQRCYLGYEKRKADLRFDLVPQDPDRWQINGVIDSDVIQNLALPVVHRRKGTWPPIINESNLSFIARFGRILKVHNFFEVDLILPNVYPTHLLGTLWQPRKDNVICRDDQKRYHLGDPITNTRRLPQKQSMKPSDGSGSMLFINLV